MNLKPDAVNSLTPYERRVLDETLTGDMEKDIALRLDRSYAGLNNAVGVIRKKLGCRNRSQLIIWAYESGYRKAGMQLKKRT